MDKADQKVPEKLPNKPSDLCAEILARSKSKLNTVLARTTAKEIRLMKESLRDSLPAVNEREIRRYRLPYYEAMQHEMKEDGFDDSAEFIAHLLQQNEEARNEAGPDSLLWLKPQLKSQDSYLEELRKGLQQAETAKKKGARGEECCALLRMAVFFMSLDENWWWVAESLFQQAVTVGSQYTADGNHIEAIIRYIYGMFLLQQLHLPDEARNHLQMAREFSAGNTWTAERELGRRQDTVFVETCRLLYTALMQMGVQTRDTDPQMSIKLCNQALRIAGDARKQGAQAEVLLELGISYRVGGDPRTARRHLERYLEHCKRLHDMHGVCRANYELSLCCMDQGSLPKALHHMEMFKNAANTHHLLDEEAAAHRCLGEYHLLKGSIHTATPHLVKSFELYHQLGTCPETEITRALTAISKGHEVLPWLCQVILDTTKPNNEPMQALVKWKDMDHSSWAYEGEEKKTRMTSIEHKSEFDVRKEEGKK